MESEPRWLGRRRPEKKFIGLPFIGWTAFFFVLSLALALLGVFHGTHLLRWLKTEDEVDLQTMGELLGGTLGVAVAFAGAWVAFQIANFANQTLQLQERREANRTANETLEQSIGKILSVQLHFEALLRQIKAYAGLVADLKPDGENGEVILDRARVEKAQNKVEAAAESLSQAIQRVLTNPLAISVLFALQEGEISDDQDAKPRQQKVEASGKQDTKRKQLLEDLSQLPRQLDDVKASLEEAINPKSLMLSPYKMLPLMNRAAKQMERPNNGVLPRLRTELDYLAEMIAQGVPVMALIDHAISFNQRIRLSNEFREPFLLHAVRYFVYTQDEARRALEKLFPAEVYQDEAARRTILDSPSAEAFVSSGQINDELMKTYLEFSARTHGRLKKLSDAAVGDDENASAIRLTVVKAVLDESHFEDESLINDLVSNSKNLTAFEIYKILTVASDKSSDPNERAEIFRKDITKSFKVKSIHKELASISREYRDVSCETQVLNTVLLATLANALHELDALSYEGADWKDSKGRLPKRDEVFEELQKRLKRAIINSVLGAADSQLRTAVIEEVEKVSCFPRAVKLLCIAVKVLCRKGYRPSDLDNLLIRGWDVENWVPGPDLLCVACEFHGLKAQATPDAVEISECSDGPKVLASIERELWLQLEFELPPLRGANSAKSGGLSWLQSLAIDDWRADESRAVLRHKILLWNDLVKRLPKAWVEVVNYRSFVLGALTGGINIVPASESNRLYLAQLIEKSAKDLGLEVTREEAVVQILPAKPATLEAASVRPFSAMLPEKFAGPKSAPEPKKPLKARVAASGGEAPHLVVVLESGGDWQKAQIDEFLHKIGQRCPLLAEAEFLRRS